MKRKRKMTTRKRFNTRGPKSRAPGGFGDITRKGYRRVWCKKEDRKKLHHVIVWEEARGRIPRGKEIHHKNHDRADNRLSNLALVTRAQNNRRKKKRR